MRYQAEHKAQTRQRVLQVAARAIRADGPDRIAVAGVMAEAGLTHGGFYAHFASKDDLVAAAIGQMFAEAAAKFEDAVAGKPPAEALSEYLAFYLSRRHRDARDTGCPLPALSTDLPRMTDAARDAFGDGVARLTARLADRIAALGRPDPKRLAASALAEMVGAVSLSRAVADPAQADAILKNARVSLGARLGLEGVR